MAVWFLKENFPEDFCVFKALYISKLILPAPRIAEEGGFWCGKGKAPGLGDLLKICVCA